MIKYLFDCTHSIARMFDFSQAPKRAMLIDYRSGFYFAHSPPKDLGYAWFKSRVG